jgi:hypothetical protein
MSTQARSADELVRQAIVTPGLLEKIKDNPAPELQKLAEAAKNAVPVIATDKVIYRIVVSALGLAAIFSVVGAIVLTGIKITPIPDILTAIGSASVGALAGLLAPSPASKS